jgi:hypothetical protein
MFRIVVMTLLTMTIAACSAIPDQNQDPTKNNLATFRKDWKECREDYPEQGSGIHIRQWEGCMNLKGWK